MKLNDFEGGNSDERSVAIILNVGLPSGLAYLAVNDK